MYVCGRANGGHTRKPILSPAAPSTDLRVGVPHIFLPVKAATGFSSLTSPLSAVAQQRVMSRCPQPQPPQKMVWPARGLWRGHRGSSGDDKHHGISPRGGVREAMLAGTRAMGWPQQASRLQGEWLFSHCAFNLKSPSTHALDFWSFTSGKPRLPSWVREEEGSMLGAKGSVPGNVVWLWDFQQEAPVLPGAGWAGAWTTLTPKGYL